MEKMGDNAAGGECVSHIIEVHPPWVGKSPGKNLKGFMARMESPDTPVYEMALLFRRPGPAYTRSSENTVTSVEPSVRTPYKAVERFVTVVNSPAIQQYFMISVGSVIAIAVGNKDQLRRHADIDSAMTDGQSRGKVQVVYKCFLLIRHAVAIRVLKNTDPVGALVRFVAAAVHVASILERPESPPVVKAERDGFTDIRFSREHGNIEAIGQRHLFHCFGWCQVFRVVGLSGGMRW